MTDILHTKENLTPRHMPQQNTLFYPFITDLLIIVSSSSSDSRSHYNNDNSSSIFLHHVVINLDEVDDYSSDFICSTLKKFFAHLGNPIKYNAGFADK